MAAAAVQTPLNAEQLFDSVGPAYEAAFATCEPQAASIQWLKSQLQGTKSRILDIGCGTGRPVCSEVADAGHEVLGIDISGAMIEAAKKSVPNAEFQKLDMGDLNPGEGSYDAITVYFSMIASVTQEQIKQNIRRIFSWLKSGGYFVFATVPVAGENMEIRWMGRQIVVSSLEAEEAVKAVKDAGFEVMYDGVTKFMPTAEEAGICSQDEVWEEPHLFVYARKP